MINTIIFDFDGVILESAEIKTVAFRKLFENDYPEEVEEIVNYHINNMGISRYVKFRHIFNNIIMQPLTLKQEEELGQRFSTIVFEEVLKAPIVSGLLEFLEEYYKTIQLFIASGTPEDELHTIVKHRGLGKYFQGIFGTPKTKAEIIFHIMNTCDLSMADIVFIGDANSDKQAAEETGVHFIARIHSGGNELDSCPYKIRDFYAFSEILKHL
ncbi:HAD family hydrolase [Syntrophomonas wolfei]|uniref:HAD family hydrolase n=1 Tax=Syntrophomonas wolfei TaxID=863 RepID=UPI0007736980|nr:HAD hydrolase-like protein [Syntrophomonas wolfei]